MTISVALVIAITISLVISTVLIAVMSKPMHAKLVDTDDCREGAEYWLPYSAIVLYLVPLFFALLVGVGSVPESGVYPAAAINRILVSILGGALLALFGIGIQLSKHTQRMTNLRLTRLRLTPPEDRRAIDAREFNRN